MNEETNSQEAPEQNQTNSQEAPEKSQTKTAEPRMASLKECIEHSRKVDSEMAREKQANDPVSRIKQMASSMDKVNEVINEFGTKIENVAATVEKLAATVEALVNDKASAKPASKSAPKSGGKS